MSTKLLTRIGLLAALLCVIAPISIPQPFGPVPLTLATLALYLLTYLLDWRHATLCCLIYLAMGLIGLPIFSGFAGGLVKLVGPTGGFLIGYLAITLIGGWFVGRFSGWLLPLTGLLLGTVFLYALGVIWLAYQSNIAISAAFLSIVPCFPGDIVKLAVAVIFGPHLKRLLPPITQQA